jgi:hypothetical protein
MVNQAFVCAEKQPSPRRSIQMNHTLSEINMPTKASLASPRSPRSDRQGGACVKSRPRHPSDGPSQQSCEERLFGGEMTVHGGV